MTWPEILAPVLASDKLVALKQHIKDGRQIKNIFPAGKEVFKAFDMCPYDDTRIVILGTEPYANGLGDGLAYSAATRTDALTNIFKEIYTDLNIQYFHNCTFDEFFPGSHLDLWTKEGILLLNATFTVEENSPGSHKGLGWELAIEEVFKALQKKDQQIIYLLWGKDAQSFEPLITNPRHLCMKAADPYLDGEKFLGCRHFSIVRDILPTLYNTNVTKSISLDCCFDKEKAKKLIKENYPIDAQGICNFIDKDLLIHVPINRENYFAELRRIEKSFSTKAI